MDDNQSIAQVIEMVERGGWPHLQELRMGLRTGEMVASLMVALAVGAPKLKVLGLGGVKPNRHGFPVVYSEWCNRAYTGERNVEIEERP